MIVITFLLLQLHVHLCGDVATNARFSTDPVSRLDFCVIGIAYFFFGLKSPATEATDAPQL